MSTLEIAWNVATWTLLGLIVGGDIKYRRRPKTEQPLWLISARLLFWVLFLIWDVTHHRSLFWRLLDIIILAVVINDLQRWWNNKGRKRALAWAGYKAEALRARMRQALGNV